ncbi:uncharacterized protein JCM6883_004384 [Sporobolomyces salmoneus]|uniref:uncharacterized protein n=1 Tax=Sporobolomyces salmoneus TaxID=183962 RepID=UPI00317D7220
MPLFKRNSITTSSVEEAGTREPSKLKKTKNPSRSSTGGGWFRRKGSMDSENLSAERRGSTDSNSSFASTSSSNSSMTLFDSPRTSISSSPPSLHRLATSSTPSLQITPPTPQLNPTLSPFYDDPPLDDNRSAVWPFSSSATTSSSSSSYTSSVFSLSSASLHSHDRNDHSPSNQDSSPSLFLSYLLKYSFPQVPPRSGSTSELMGVRQLSEARVNVEDRRGEEEPRRLIDYYLDSSLRA